MKKYKIRFNCASFHDIVVEAKNEKEAIKEACLHTICPDNGMEFGEFLPVDTDDEIDD